jgi:hypothetical protein
MQPEAKFLDVIGTKVFRDFFFAIHGHLTSVKGFYSPSPPGEKVA